MRTPVLAAMDRCRNPSGPHAIPFARLLPFLSAISALPAADGQLVQASYSLRAFRDSGLPHHRAPSLPAGPRPGRF
jgi:hypothetical protein